MSKPRCKATGKRKYPDQLEAAVAFSNHPHLIRFYRCPHCDQWHGSAGSRFLKSVRAA